MQLSVHLTIYISHIMYRDWHYVWVLLEHVIQTSGIFKCVFARQVSHFSFIRFHHTILWEILLSTQYHICQVRASIKRAQSLLVTNFLTHFINQIIDLINLQKKLHWMTLVLWVITIQYDIKLNMGECHTSHISTKV